VRYLDLMKVNLSEKITILLDIKICLERYFMKCGKLLKAEKFGDEL
jgi:hypothetical protein